MVEQQPDDNIVVGQLQRVKEEVDALQIHVMKDSKAWYAQPSTIVSVVAVLVSLWSALTTENIARQQNSREDRAELRELLQRLHALPRENIELTLEYGAEPVVLAQLQGVLATENAALTNQALGIVKRLDGQTSGSERLALTGALYNSGRIVEAVEISRQVVEMEEAAALDVLTALRNIAANHFALGEFRQGRELLQDALDLWQEKFPTEHPQFRHFSDANTEIRWAQMEVVAGQCEQGKEHLDQARRLVDEQPLMFDANFRQQVQELDRMVGYCQLGQPIPLPFQDRLPVETVPTLAPPAARAAS